MENLPALPDLKYLINQLNRDIVEKIPFLPTDSIPVVLGKLGNLEIRLAQTKREIKQAQKLRYRIFYKEMGAIADLKSMLAQRDIDPYDEYCDHLLVVDTEFPRKKIPGTKQRFKEKVVGTYRLLLQDVAQRHVGFYSDQEYDVADLLQRNPGKRFLELGRSCVDSAYRDKRTIELLWRGIWWYINETKTDALIGCASLEGKDPQQHRLALSFLLQECQASSQYQTSAKHGANIELLPADSLDKKAALHSLPPLIKGYLRCGARFAREAVVDHQFNTTDVFVVLPVEEITPRYREHFTMQ